MLVLLKGLIFPIVFVGSFIGLDALLGSGVSPGVSVFAVSVANLAIVALLEIAVPLRPEWAWWRDGQTVNDLIHGALLSTLGPRLGEIAMTSTIAAGAAALAALAPGGLWPTAWPLWAELALAIVLADFADWTKHWAYHNVPLLWPIHALHHNSDKMHVMKAARLHFLEAAIRFAIIAAPLLILGASPEVIVWYGALANFLGNLNHSNVDMPMPGFMHYLFATPQAHRLHHSLDADLGRSNLSSVTLLPDLLFGTFRHPDVHPLDAVGIAEDPIPANLLGQLATPLLWPVLVWSRRRRELPITTRARD